MKTDHLQRIEAAAPGATLLAACVPVEIQASPDMGDGEGDGTPKLPTFSIVGYTGAPMLVGGYYTPVIIDLAGLKVRSQEIPALHNHDFDRVVGQTTAVKIGSDVRLEGVITGSNDYAEEVVTQAKNGFKWQASVGATVDRREFVDAGKKVTVNGREVSGPILVARESTLLEISFVPIGADTATSAAVAASNPVGQSQKGNAMNFDDWLKAKGFDPAALSDTQKAALQAAFDAEQPKGDGGTGTETEPPAPKVNAGAKVKAEVERLEKIEALTKRYKADKPWAAKEIDKLEASAIQAGDAPELYQLELVRLRAPAVHVAASGSGVPDAKVIEAAVCRIGGLPGLESHYDARTLEASDRYRNRLELSDLFVMAAQASGQPVPHRKDVKNLLIASGFGLPSMIQAEGFSTFGLPGILSNIANKFLLTSFLSIESAWRAISRIRPVNDFKTISSYALTGGFEYQRVAANGEIKSGTVGEVLYTNKADTYGRMFSITREDIINDDLGALTQVPTRLGRGAGLALNRVVWTSFLGGVGTFWAAGNNNLITGAGTALSSASLRQAVLTFRKQTDPDGQPLGSEPRILLVPPELEFLADELMTSALVNTGGSSTLAQVPNRNVWNSKFQVVTSTYLSNTAFTGNSTTAWFLLADPADLAAIEVAFLNGRDTPIVESAEMDFNNLGVQMRGYFDFGANRQEFRSSVRSAGA